jgi:hypothetical protein
LLLDLLEEILLPALLEYPVRSGFLSPFNHLHGRRTPACADPHLQSAAVALIRVASPRKTAVRQKVFVPAITAFSLPAMMLITCWHHQTVLPAGRENFQRPVTTS